MEAAGQLGASCVALHQALFNHKVNHVRFLPNPWRKQ